jgi:phage tail tape-measure protein
MLYGELNMNNSRVDEMDRSQIKNMSDEAKSDLNADPITGEPGSHPIGTGVGAVGVGALGAVAGAAAAGATVGAVAGPLGALAGAAVGTIIGGIAGHAAGEKIDPTKEGAYWREVHRSAPYHHNDTVYEKDYRYAYQLGYDARAQHPKDTHFSQVEDQLHLDWERNKGDSALTWEEAKSAAKNAWDRLS